MPAFIVKNKSWLYFYVPKTLFKTERVKFDDLSQWENVINTNTIYTFDML